MKGVVAAGHEVTARAAAEMLRRNGNAFDAALAGMLAACVPETVLASLGGGGFLMAHNADKDTTVLYDFFAHTPRLKRPLEAIDFHAIHADFGPATQEFHIGAGASATPGVIPGLFAVHQDLCTLPLTTIIEPAVNTAREGVEMSAFHAYLFTVIAPILQNTPETSALFAPKSELLKTGELFRNPALADTLENLASEGARFSIDGELGRAIVEQSRDEGGHLTRDDLASYRVERRTPLAQRYRDALLHLNPAPSLGGPLIGFSLGALQQMCPSAPPDPGDLVTAMRLANEVRGAGGVALDELADDAVIAQQLAQARAHSASTRGTTHISVIDEKGNAAALTISNGEGNGLILGKTGIMLNNMLGEEDLFDTGFHNWRVDTRLSSMMAPSLITHKDGSLTALGSGGSNRIRSALLQTAVNLIDREMPLENAVDAPRLHLEKCSTLSFENSPERAPLSASAKDCLRQDYPDAKAWPEPNMFFGGVHAVQKNAGAKTTLSGIGDKRRDGTVLWV